MDQADRIYRERAIRDARTQAELQAIEAQRRAEMEQLNFQQLIERDRYYRQLQTEQERQQRSPAQTYGAYHDPATPDSRH